MEGESHGGSHRCRSQSIYQSVVSSIPLVDSALAGDTYSRPCWAVAIARNSGRHEVIGYIHGTVQGRNQNPQAAKQPSRSSASVSRSSLPAPFGESGGLVERGSNVGLMPCTVGLCLSVGL